MRIIKMPGFDVILFSQISMLLGVTISHLTVADDPTKQLKLLEIGFIFGKIRIKI